MSIKIIKNFTPHDVHIGEKGKGVFMTFPSDGVARVEKAKNIVDSIRPHNNYFPIPIFKSDWGDVQGLPKEEEGTILIVSSFVKAAMPGRKDLVHPINFIMHPFKRNYIIGCEGFGI